MGHDHRHGHDHHHDHDHDHGHHAHHDHGSGHQHGRPDEAPRIHKAAAPVNVRAAVITASDTRDAATDTSGNYVRHELEDRGHTVVSKEIVKDDAALVVGAVERARTAGAEVVIVTGGTGISRRDSTFEAVDALLTRRLPGFGELFRMLSYEEIGSAAMLSRATAGITADGLIVFAIPGSTGACRTAVEKLIAPELPHLVREVNR